MLFYHKIRKGSTFPVIGFLTFITTDVISLNSLNLAGDATLGYVGSQKFQSEECFFTNKFGEWGNIKAVFLIHVCSKNNQPLPRYGLEKNK